MSIIDNEYSLEKNEGEIFKWIKNFKSKTVSLRFCYNLKYLYERNL